MINYTFSINKLSPVLLLRRNVVFNRANMDTTSLQLSLTIIRDKNISVPLRVSPYTLFLIDFFFKFLPSKLIPIKEAQNSAFLFSRRKVVIS